MSIIGIVAIDRNSAIGKGGTLPWHYSSDMKFFKQQTMGHAIVMGARTWKTIGKPLPGRLNVVLSRSMSEAPVESVVVLNDRESVLDLARTHDTDTFIIGGAKVYATFLGDIDRWIVTEVPLSVEGADTFMPEGFLDGFEVTETRDIGEGLMVKFYRRA